MSVKVIVGAQWGDEGKGKIVDLLSENVDIVARYQGGANAGHTVVVDGKTYVLHLIPSGILHRKVVCVIGNGVVLDPQAFLDEVSLLKSHGIDVTGRLFISHNAHLIMPYHKLIDSLKEQGASKIGTTGRGIGPAYIDKFARTGIKLVDLLHRDTLVKKIRANIDDKNQILSMIYHSSELNVEEIVDMYLHYDTLLDQYIKDTALYLNQELKSGKRVLAEGAQGAMLDVDFGTYPYVTSSNPTSGGACTGLGIPPTAVDSVIGVAKAYTTRVGNGPFPTEQDNAIGEMLRKTGGEYGATTGRPRRCGWLDLFSLRYSVMVNGIENIALTKLDVLDDLDEIKVCVGYNYNKKPLKSFPLDLCTIEDIEPDYKSLPGWKSKISGAKKMQDLPKNCRSYIEFIESYLEIPAGLISVGATRDQTIVGAA
ncbi:MAG TPA: adenylosuccinate synthase [Candidatus Kryptonia bacterium]